MTRPITPWLPARTQEGACIFFHILGSEGHGFCRFEGAAARLAGRPPLFFGKWVGAGPASAAPFDTLATQPGIVDHVWSECERVYPDSITVSHGMRAVGGNVCTGEVVLEDSAGGRHERQFDMVVGADGAGSAVRQLIQEQVCPPTECTAVQVLNMHSEHA